VPRAGADFVERGPEARGEALEDLRVAVHGGHHPLDDRREVLEPDLEERLGVDAVDLQADTAQGRIDADVELHEIQDLGGERHARLQLVDVQFDLVDVEPGDVEQDVRLVALRQCGGDFVA
jgi:hypothetical protein